MATDTDQAPGSDQHFYVNVGDTSCTIADVSQIGRSSLQIEDIVELYLYLS